MVHMVCRCEDDVESLAGVVRNTSATQAHFTRVKSCRRLPSSSNRLRALTARVVGIVAVTHKNMLICLRKLRSPSQFAYCRCCRRTFRERCGHKKLV